MTEEDALAAQEESERLRIQEAEAPGEYSKAGKPTSHGPLDGPGHGHGQ